jgi:hypothetical protein
MKAPQRFSPSFATAAAFLAFLLGACTPYAPPDDSSSVPTSLTIEDPGASGSLYLNGTLVDFSNGHNSISSPADSFQTYKISFVAASGYAFADFWVEESGVQARVYSNPMTIDMMKTTLEVGVEAVATP